MPRPAFTSFRNRRANSAGRPRASGAFDELYIGRHWSISPGLKGISSDAAPSKHLEGTIGTAYKQAACLLCAATVNPVAGYFPASHVKNAMVFNHYRSYRRGGASLAIDMPARAC